jgi:hypothetical protein
MQLERKLMKKLYLPVVFALALISGSAGHSATSAMATGPGIADNPSYL